MKWWQEAIAAIVVGVAALGFGLFMVAVFRLMFVTMLGG